MTTTAITVISAHSSTAILGFDTSILAGQVAPSSMRLYAQDLAAYLQFAEYSADVALRPSTLARWRNHLVQNTTQSASTINRRLSGVKSTFKWAAEVEEGCISARLAEEFAQVRGVKAKALKERQPEDNRTWMEPAEIRKIASAPDATRLSGKMHRALLFTLASSACRISDVCGLTQSQIALAADDKGCPGWCLMVTGKNETKPEARPITQEAHGYIQEWLAARAAAGVTSEYVFTAFAGRGDSRLSDKPLSTAGAWQMVQRYAAQVGLVHIKPHDFRRSAGTAVHEKYGLLAAQKLLGHKDSNTTARHYIKPKKLINVTEGLF